MELEGWDCYSLNHASRSKNTPILVVDGGGGGGEGGGGLLQISNGWSRDSPHA